MKKAKRLIAITLVLIVSLGCFSLICSAEESETPEHLTEVPEGYLGIYTKDDLDSIKLDMAGKYILMNDIVFNDSDYVKGGSFYNSGKGWEPIGTSSTNFTGVFDGNGYKIKNLYIKNPEQDYIGLFGYMNNATVKNITVENGNITGGNYTGGIVGYITKSNLIGCDFVGNVYGNDYIGGVTGCSDYRTTISYCNTQGFVSGKIYVGGIAGKQRAYAEDGKTEYNCIKYCNNSAEISAESTAGGIAGESQSYSAYYCRTGYAYIQYCSNGGSVTAKESQAGGIIGNSLCFEYEYDKQDAESCYNTGEITATSYAGGIVGRSNSKVTRVKHCYSVGAVTATSNFGGCFGSSPYSTTFCYYLDESVTDPTCTVGIAKSEDQLKKATAFEQWDFTNTWTMAGREDYPYPELVDVPLVLPKDYVVHEHKYTSEITTPATHLIEGVKTFTCTCGDTYTETIEKTTEHSFTLQITKEATHLTTGIKTFTCACGYSYTELVPKTTAHTYTASTIAPTCTEKGYTTYTCNCGDSYVTNYVNAKGHDYSTEYVVDKEATCQEIGSKSQHCSRCDSKRNATTIPITSHADNDFNGYCDFCNKFVVTSGVCGDNLTWTFDESTNTLFISGTGAMDNYSKDEIRPWDGHVVKNVVINNGVTTIGDYAFRMNNNITSIVIADSVTTTGYGAFIYCQNLTSVTIGSGVTTIPYASFWECDNLKSVNIPDSVTTIENYAFNGCDNLVSVTIGCGINKIGSGSFKDCDDLTDVYYSGTELQWNKITIGPYNEDLTNATIHYNTHCHEYVLVVTTPTCTEQGFTTYTCKCGDTYKSDYVKAQGHTPANAVEENYVAPTCTGTGSKDVVIYCSICNEEINGETVIIDAIGHTDNDVDGYCDVCDELLNLIDECECNCHKSGISKFFFNFVLFFQKIFGSNKTCACGVAHY